MLKRGDGRAEGILYGGLQVRHTHATRPCLILITLPSLNRFIKSTHPHARKIRYIRSAIVFECIRALLNALRDNTNVLRRRLHSDL